MATPITREEFTEPAEEVAGEKTVTKLDDVRRALRRGEVKEVACRGVAFELNEGT